MQRKFNSIFKSTIAKHIIAWLLYFAFNTIRWGIYFNDLGYSLQSNLVEFSIHLIIVYFNLLVLIPRLIPNKIWWYFASILTSVIAISFLRIVLTYEFVTTDIYRESMHQGIALFDFNYVLATVVGEFYVVGLTTAISFGVKWINFQDKSKELENKTLESELAYLRSQIQPHFFFNTLNNLYSLTLIKSDQAPETVLKLSEVMSYVIYQGKLTRVSIHNEITHIQNYIDLEKLRYGDRLDAKLDITGDISGKFIPPLILLPFIENSFKHGVGHDLKSIPIEIKIRIEENILYFSIENEYAPNQTMLNSVNHNAVKGIGLENTKRRLNILFNNAYRLDINKTDKRYSVNLKMPVYGEMSDR